MRLWTFGIRAAAFGASLLAVSPLIASPSWAARSAVTPAHSVTVKPAVKIVGTKIGGGMMKLSVVRRGLPVTRILAHVSMGGSKQFLLKGGKARYASRSGGLQCVPFARAATGIEIKGNAANWWDSANGVYARGQAPESGSVLNFRATGSMRLGHVAVVTHVVDAREIEIDHANWAGPGASKGGVSRSIPVVDVSENNDWSAVRVGLGHSGSYGSIYPTYGFIYDRPDNGMIAANGRGRQTQYDEVAEAPSRAIR